MPKEIEFLGNFGHSLSCYCQYVLTTRIWWWIKSTLWI